MSRVYLLLASTAVVLPLLWLAAGTVPASEEPASKDRAWVEVDPATVQPIGAVAATEAESGAVREIEWDDLIPDDYRPDLLMAEFNVDAISDDDPRAAELMAKIQELWDKAPVRPELDGQNVKLPGFVVPVEGDAEETTGFLLVPYYGACIHVPPPPANQTVYVVTEEGQGAPPGLFDVVWVTGEVKVERVESELAEAGYTLHATGVEPYEP